MSTSRRLTLGSAASYTKPKPYVESLAVSFVYSISVIRASIFFLSIASAGEALFSHIL
jgi:hypothetical protein